MTTDETSPPLLEAAVQTLQDWNAPDAAQDKLRAQYVAHLRARPDGIWRGGPPEHLTASCFVLDPTGEHILLTLHRRGGFWVQFGGHLELGDTSLADAAAREAAEESGLKDLTLLPAGAPVPVDLSWHGLSSAFGRCSEHLDVAFVAVAPADAVPAVSDESDDVAWWPVDALPPHVVPDLSERLGAVREMVRQHRTRSSYPATASALPCAADVSALGSTSASPMSSPDAAAMPSR